MITPEHLRYFPYFAGISPECLRAVAMISDERTLQPGTELCHEEAPATHLYILSRGHLDIVATLAGGRKVTVDSIVPGELAAYSSLLEPYRLKATVVARDLSTVIAINAPDLRDLCERDAGLGFRLMTEVAKVLKHRLDGAVSQLAAV